MPLAPREAPSARNASLSGLDYPFREFNNFARPAKAALFCVKHPQTGLVRSLRTGAFFNVRVPRDGGSREGRRYFEDGRRRGGDSGRGTKWWASLEMPPLDPRKGHDVQQVFCRIAVLPGPTGRGTIASAGTIIGAMSTVWTVVLIAFIAILALNCLWVGIQLWRNKSPKSKIYARIQGTLLITVVVAPALAVFHSRLDSVRSRR